MNLIEFASLFIIITVFICKNTTDNKQILEQKKLYNDQANAITNGKILIEYSPDKGYHCKADKDLKRRELAFKVPKEYILCSFDLFPLKFELIEAIYPYMLRNKNERADMFTYVFSYYLLMVENNRTENVSTKFREYLKTLSKVLHTKFEYREGENKLLKFLGYEKDSNNIKELHEFTMQYLKEKFPDVSKDYIGVLDNLDSLSGFAGIVSSRAYHTDINFYEHLHDKKIKEGPLGDLQQQVIDEIPEADKQPCLIPFSDLCNHFFNSTNQNEIIDNIQIWKKDFIYIGYDKMFSRGNDYEFSYLPFSPNEKLLLSYGFYIENNLHSSTRVLIEFDLHKFNKEKYNLCKKLKCFPYSFDYLYDDDHKDISEANIELFVGKKFEFNEGVLKALKLMMLDNKNLDQAYKRIKGGLMIDYDSEVKSLAYFRSSVIKEMNKRSLSYEDIVYSLYNTKLFYKSHLEAGTNGLENNYHMRRKIMKVGKEFQYILNKNVESANGEIRRKLSDQFKKTKDYLINK